MPASLNTHMGARCEDGETERERIEVKKPRRVHRHRSHRDSGTRDGRFFGRPRDPLCFASGYNV